MLVNFLNYAMNASLGLGGLSFILWGVGRFTPFQEKGTSKIRRYIDKLDIFLVTGASIPLLMVVISIITILLSGHSLPAELKHFFKLILS